MPMCWSIEMLICLTCTSLDTVYLHGDVPGRSHFKRGVVKRDQEIFLIFIGFYYFIS